MPEPPPRRGRAGAKAAAGKSKAQAESVTSRRREVTKYTGPVGSIHVTQTACSKFTLFSVWQLKLLVLNNKSMGRGMTLTHLFIESYPRSTICKSGSSNATAFIWEALLCERLE